MPIPLIINPASGWRTSAFLNKCLKEFSHRGVELEVLETQHPGHASEIADNLRAQGCFDRILVAGGDGTVREVASQLLDSPIKLGVIPKGNANVLARELGYRSFPAFDTRQTVDIVTGDRDIAIYPFRLELLNRTSLAFCWWSLGLDAQVLHILSPVLKKKWGRLAFIPAILQVLRDNGPEITQIRITGTNQEIIQSRWFVASNIRRYGGPFRVFPDAKPGEQKCSIASISSPAGISGAAWILLMILGKSGRGIVRLESVAGNMNVESGDPHVQIDGDYVCRGSPAVSISETGVRFLTNCS